jgi:predicted Zn-dependent protease
VACARNPVTGEQQIILMSTDQEKRIDAEAAEQIEQQIGLVQDPALNAYVDEIGQALAANSPRQDVRYSFHILAMDEPNAFALPGGHIYISRGLLALTNNESELANVLGHEIGHVAARHAAQRDALMKVMQVMNVLATVGVAAGGATNAGTGGPVGNPGLYSFSRKHESEADEIGQDLAVMTGIDPGGMGTLMKSLDSSTRLKIGYSRQTSYFDTHPAASERAAAAATAAQVRRWKASFALARNRTEYYARLEGLELGTPAAEGVVVDDRFMHPDLGIALRFPSGWEIKNTQAAVIGVSPGQGAALMLELAGEGDDAEAAALAFLEAGHVEAEQAGPIVLGDFDAYRLSGALPTAAGNREAVVAFIAHEGLIFRLTGFALRGKFARFEGVFRSFARRFTPLAEADRALIDELQLQITTARGGETLAELSARTGNTWALTETAVFNRIRTNAKLEAGQPIKIAIRVPYTGSHTPEADSPNLEIETQPASE